MNANKYRSANEFVRARIIEILASVERPLTIYEIIVSDGRSICPAGVVQTNLDMMVIEGILKLTVKKPEGFWKTQLTHVFYELTPLQRLAVL